MTSRRLKAYLHRASDIIPPEDTKDKDNSTELKSTYIKSVKHKKNKLVIVIKKVPMASGYEVTYRRKKRGKKKSITVSGWTNNRVVLKKLKKCRYRIKVRTYAERNGKRYYSKYSKSHRIKI